MQAISLNGVPDLVVIDKSCANLAWLHGLNVILKFANAATIIKILQIKYLNNIPRPGSSLHQIDHRPYTWFQSFSFRHNNLILDQTRPHEP